MKRLLLAAAFGLLSISACAKAPASADDAKPAQGAATAPAEITKPAPGSPEERAVAAIAALNPEVKVDHVGKAPMPGFREAVVGGQVIYVSDDGNYLLFTGAGGGLLDTRTQKNLSEATLGGMRNKLLQTIPAGERIVFAPPNPKHTVTVFTDVECGYCRKMHEEIKQYNAEGIAVEYLAFPRIGIGSEGYNDMVSVWCAPDRKSALTKAKSTGEVESRNCRNTVADQYKVGQSVGLTGTPMIIARDGSQLGGYLPAKALRAALDKLEASDG
ncbi:DsbC family protein [Lysobacter ciconiae]|uniref:Thiol:disulfide interchange protein n=1 Tax=Novilysobacter ciconiae TaxID=2781022 RepID=A0A7S6UF68_9GAMM|nr:DsbC family protein [Lysobacter ciconiae]QOW19153.1 DsbC family protein [Lysobacter ciconiae]